MMWRSRTPEVMADAAYHVLTSNSRETTGNFFTDEEVLRAKGLTNFDKYLHNPKYRDEVSMDFFLNDEDIAKAASTTQRPKL